MATPDTLRVAVVGAGVVGCYLGGLLTRSARVTLVGRPHVLDPIAQHGLTVESAEQRIDVPAYRLALTPRMDAVRDADIVLVCTKSGSTAEVTRQFAPFLRDEAVIVGFQNGLHSADLVREGVDDHTVLAGMIPFNVARTGPATYRRTSAGRIVIEQDPASETLVTVMRAAGLDVRADADMPAVLHGKVLVNLNNAIQALAGVPLRTELLDRDFRRCVSLCQAEALRTFTAAGIIPHVPVAVPAGLMPTLLRLPTPLFRMLAAATLQVDAAATSSMTDDLLAGRRTEVDDLQGEVVRMGERLGVDTPVCARVVELVHDAEAAGADRRRWRSRDLLDELTAARRGARGLAA